MAQFLLESMDDLIKVQRDSADYNEYMRGMYNGMVLMKSLVDGNDPEYLDPPERNEDNG